VNALPTSPNRTPATIAAVLVLLVVAGQLAACSGARNRRQALQDAVQSYNTAIRWGHVQKAARYVQDKDRGAFIASKRRAYKRLRVHEVELRSVNLGAKQERARVLVAMAFSVAGNPVTRHHTIEQVWRHKRSGWVLVKRRRVKAGKPAPPTPGDLY
jgi:hypothetical protein